MSALADIVAELAYRRSHGARTDVIYVQGASWFEEAAREAAAKVHTAHDGWDHFYVGTTRVQLTR